MCRGWTKAGQRKINLIFFSFVAQEQEEENDEYEEDEKMSWDEDTTPQKGGY